MPPGTMCLLTGLVKSPECNGREATISGFDEAKGRYVIAVEFGGGMRLNMSVLPERLARLAPKSGGGGTAAAAVAAATPAAANATVATATDAAATIATAPAAAATTAATTAPPATAASIDPALHPSPPKRPNLEADGPSPKRACSGSSVVSGVIASPSVPDASTHQLVTLTPLEAEPNSEAVECILVPTAILEAASPRPDISASPAGASRGSEEDATRAPPLTGRVCGTPGCSLGDWHSGVCSALKLPTKRGSPGRAPGLLRDGLLVRDGLLRD